MADEYWTLPEDLTANWAALREKFQRQAAGKGNHQLDIRVIAEHGLATAVIEVEPCPMETILVAVPRSVDWWQIIRRLRSKAPPNGKVMLRTFVILDAQENPISWTVPQCNKVL